MKFQEVSKAVVRLEGGSINESRRLQLRKWRRKERGERLRLPDDFWSMRTQSGLCVRAHKGV